MNVSIVLHATTRTERSVNAKIVELVVYRSIIYYSTISIISASSLLFDFVYHREHTPHSLSLLIVIVVVSEGMLQTHVFVQIKRKNNNPPSLSTDMYPSISNIKSSECNNNDIITCNQYSLIQFLIYIYMMIVLNHIKHLTISLWHHAPSCLLH